MMGLPDGSKSFRIGLVVLIQTDRQTDSQPATQSRCRSYNTLNAKASSLKTVGMGPTFTHFAVNEAFYFT